MTNEEKAEQIARDMLPYNNAEYHACYNSAIKAMKWKDDEHAKEKQQWIEKACEWFLEQSFGGWIEQPDDEFIEEFVKAMKGE